MLLRQGADIDLVLRLIAASFRTRQNGTFRLGSFDNILNFLGRRITDEPEHSVQPSPLTPYVVENPINTMEIVES